jgi:hypothetical protein
MSDFEIDFENEVGHFEFVPASREKIEFLRKRTKRAWKMSETDASLHLGRLVRRGHFKTVRLTSAMLEQAVRALVEWKKPPFGKVVATVASTVGSLPTGMHDSMPAWRGVSYRLRNLFEGKNFAYDEKNWRGPKIPVAWPHPAAQEVGELGIFLVPDKDGKPVLALRAHDVRDALYLAAARMIARGATLGICLNCESPFLRGAGSKRRGDARFCTPRCKWEYQNEARRKAKSKS